MLLPSVCSLTHGPRAGWRPSNLQLFAAVAFACVVLILGVVLFGGPKMPWFGTGMVMDAVMALIGLIMVSAARGSATGGARGGMNRR